MMIANQVKTLIRENATSLGVEPGLVFAYAINKKSNVESLDKIVILITEIDNSVDRQGSNVSISRRGRVQVQVFFPPTYADDTTIITEKLLDLMESDDWYNYFDGGTERGPQTQQFFNTSHYEKSYERSVD